MNLSTAMLGRVVRRPWFDRRPRGSILDDTIVTGQRLVTRVLGSDSVARDHLYRSRRA